MMTVVIEPIPDADARRLRIDLLAHTSNPQTGRCPRCGIRDCEPYRQARAELILAGRFPIPGLVCTPQDRRCTGHYYLSSKHTGRHAR